MPTVRRQEATARSVNSFATVEVLVPYCTEANSTDISARRCVEEALMKCDRGLDVVAVVGESEEREERGGGEGHAYVNSHIKLGRLEAKAARMMASL